MLSQVPLSRCPVILPHLDVSRAQAGSTSEPVPRVSEYSPFVHLGSLVFTAFAHPHLPGEELLPTSLDEGHAVH